MILNEFKEIDKRVLIRDAVMLDHYTIEYYENLSLIHVLSLYTVDKAYFVYDCIVKTIQAEYS